MSTTEPTPVTLPPTVKVTAEFMQRIPAQRVLDILEKVEPGSGEAFGVALQHQPTRVIAFRALLKDFPDYDPSALWLHAYDVEVELQAENPTNGTSPTPAPGSDVSIA